MAHQVDSAVLIVSALGAFFATFFAVLLLLQPEQPVPARSELAKTSAEPLPPVAAAPPVEEIPTAPVVRSPDPALELLGHLGVRCADTANCEQGEQGEQGD